MKTRRTSVLASLALLLTALACGTTLAYAAASDAPATAGSGFDAPEGTQLSAARELPERFQVLFAAGTSKPAAAPQPRISATVLPAAASAHGAAPLFLVHCAFLC